MAAPQCRLVLIKRMTYRGIATEEWSNAYMLSGAKPADSTAWRAVFDALCAQERTCYTNESSIIGGYGYDSVADSATAVWSVDLTVTPNTPLPGTLAQTGNKIAGDQAAWVRWGLDKFNSKGKRIYLRKYFHSGRVDATNQDTLYSGWTTALNAFGAKLQDGSFLDARVLTDSHGTALVGHGVGPYITTRTLKRRGKRPPTT